MMKINDRRQFLKTVSVLGLAPIAQSNLFGMSKKYASRKFTMSLSPGAIGVKASQTELVDMARQYGFEAIDAMPAQLAKMSKGALDELTGKMKDAGLSWGVAGLPVQFRQSEQLFREHMNTLPGLAAALSHAGGMRMSTWIMPTDPHLTYRENFRQHTSRLHEVANVLGHHGIRLGLEYVGPKTLMARDKFSFIRTMKECKELIHSIAESNVGFVLDSFHWFCAGESPADLLTLDNSDIVACDLNDAVAGVTADDQLDNRRELPMATGEVDTKSFLETLVKIGYDGPVRAEPF